VGNGRLLAGFDATGSLRMLAWPHLDFPQHIGSSQLTFGGRAAGWPNGTGWHLSLIHI